MDNFLLLEQDGPSLGKQVKMFRNGDVSDGKNISIALTWTTDAFLSVAGRRLGLAHPSRIFAIDGAEIEDVTSIEEDDTIFISEGEDFLRPEGSGAAVAGYEVQQILGKGGFGEVRLGSHLVSKMKVALKFMSKATFRSASAAERVVAEIQALTELRHPSVIKMLQVVNQVDFVVLVFEFAAGGDLFDYVKDSKLGHLSEKECRNIFRQILAAVAYAHNHNICHGDLKLDNILLANRQVTNRAEDAITKKESTDENQDDAKHVSSHNLEVKVADFGLSVFLKRGEKTKAVGGSTSYMAPEVWNNQNIDGPALDVWCLGCILFSMLTGRLPFDDGTIGEFKIPSDETMIRKVNALDYTFKQSQLSRIAKDCVAKQLVVSMTDRTTIPLLFNHPWMAHRRDSDMDISVLGLINNGAGAQSEGPRPTLVDGNGNSIDSVEFSKQTSDPQLVGNSPTAAIDTNEMFESSPNSIFTNMSPVLIGAASTSPTHTTSVLPSLALASPGSANSTRNPRNSISAAEYAQAKINEITLNSGIKNMATTGNNDRGRFLKGLNGRPKKSKSGIGGGTPLSSVKKQLNSPTKVLRKNGVGSGSSGNSTDVAAAGNDLFQVESSANKVSTPMTPTPPGSLKKKRSGGPPRFGRKQTPKGTVGKKKVMKAVAT